MLRKITNEIVKWKESIDRMPLLIHGARQVGKTYIIKKFGKNNYENVIYVNLELEKEIIKDFEESIKPEFIINRLELYFGEHIKKEKTLIFIDEIQVSERALTSLKYFCEEAPEYNIIVAGSLLGIVINRKKYSFPVGKVKLLDMYPMDFEEFLWALGRENLSKEIRKCYFKNKNIGESLHALSLELYRTYLIVGGMPNSINKYLLNKKILDSSGIKNDILNNYIADMSKYTSNSEAIKVKNSYNSIPVQLAKDNKKFQYKVVQKGGTSTIFGVALEWLESAGIILRCNRIDHGYLPIDAYRDLSSFKIYMSDIGLLTTRANIPLHSIMSDNNIQFSFMGAIAENYVAQALKTNGFELFYWTSKNTAEVDFIIQLDGNVVPVEVKAGFNTRSRSLNIYKKKYNPKYSIRISAKEFGFENDIKSVPLYAVFCIKDKMEY
ncbi:MAG: AAA family ATPase [Bacillota bacterium]|nr:AAA family ATPase [Bacillota bacterium]